MVHRTRYDDWSLPKGKLRRHEPPLLGARREVWEETGVEPTVGPCLGTSRYRVGDRVKSVRYWSMRGRNGRFQPTREVDRLVWYRLDQARQVLTYRADVALLDRLEQVAAPVDSVILLVSPASAGDPDSWSGDQRDRPLDAGGRRQAETLRSTLRLFEPSEVRAADLVRCVDTVAPLAADLDVALQPDPALSEPDAAMARLTQLAAGARTPRLPVGVRGVVVCAEAKVVAHAVGELVSEPVGLTQSALPRDGSLWALFFSHGQLLAADYYPAGDGSGGR